MMNILLSNPKFFISKASCKLATANNLKFFLLKYLATSIDPKPYAFALITGIAFFCVKFSI